MLKNQKFKEQHFVPKLLGTGEIGLPPAGAKTNELIAKNVHTRGFVLVDTCIV